MRTLTFATNVSVDGYVAGPDGDLTWSSPSDELFDFWSERVAATSLALYGRGMWEGMSGHWPTADQQPGVSPAHAAYARRWRAMPKVVFSSSLARLDGDARLVTGDAVTEIARLKSEDGGPIDIGGATLAAAAVRAGLVDEYLLVTHPALVGAGMRVLPLLEQQVPLTLAETRTFSGGAVLTRYLLRR